MMMTGILDADWSYWGDFRTRIGARFIHDLLLSELGTGMERFHFKVLYKMENAALATLLITLLLYIFSKSEQKLSFKLRHNSQVSYFYNRDNGLGLTTP